jgi:hypothetical protein
MNKESNLERIVKGAAAGLVAGLVASWAANQFHLLWSLVAGEEPDADFPTEAAVRPFSWKCFPGAGGLVDRSGIFAFDQFRILSVEGRLAQMRASDLFQLGHKVSQGLVASVQPISKVGANHHGFLIRSPSLS